MSERFDEIVARAMSLPQEQRVRLAEELIASLDGEIEADVEELWLAEAEKRLNDFRSGKTPGIPADEAFARARQALRG